MSKGYFELETLYEGERIKIYRFPDRLEGKGFPVYERSEELLKLRDKKQQTQMLHGDGYVWWTGRNYPTHVVTAPNCFNAGAYVVKKGGNPPEDVQFLDQLSYDEQNRYTACRSALFKVKVIPKVFAPDYGRWVTLRENVYENYKPRRDSRAIYLEVNVDELAVLEKAGLSFHPTGYYQDSKSKYFSGWVEEPLPTRVWIDLKAKAELWESVPECFLQDTMPLYIDGSNFHLPYFVDSQGGYWQVCEQKVLDKETARVMLGVENEVRFDLNDSHKTYGLSIPLEYVQAAGGTLQVFPDKSLPNSLNLKVGITKGEVKNCQERCLYQYLQLRRNYLIRSHSDKRPNIWLVSDEKAIEELNLTPLKAGERTRDNEVYEIVWVEDYKLVRHPKQFGKKEQIYSIRVSKRQRQHYDNLNLRHRLPAPIYQWNIEDLVEYDRLVEQEDYHADLYLRLGQRLIPAPVSIRHACSWQTKAFVSKDKKLNVRLYKALSWFDAVEQIRNRRNPNKEELIETFTKAVAYGLSAEPVLHQLCYELGISNVEIVNILAERQNA